MGMSSVCGQVKLNGCIQTGRNCRCLHGQNMRSGRTCMFTRIKLGMMVEGGALAVLSGWVRGLVDSTISGFCAGPKLSRKSRHKAGGQL